jgi:hypothetical protein
MFFCFDCINFFLKNFFKSKAQIIFEYDPTIRMLNHKYDDFLMIVQKNIFEINWCLKYDLFDINKEEKEFFKKKILKIGEKKKEKYIKKDLFIHYLDNYDWVKYTPNFILNFIKKNYNSFYIYTINSNCYKNFKEIEFAPKITTDINFFSNLSSKTIINYFFLVCFEIMRNVYPTQAILVLLRVCKGISNEEANCVLKISSNINTHIQEKIDKKSNEMIANFINLKNFNFQSIVFEKNKNYNIYKKNEKQMYNSITKEKIKKLNEYNKCIALKKDYYEYEKAITTTGSIVYPNVDKYKIFLPKNRTIYSLCNEIKKYTDFFIKSNFNITDTYHLIVKHYTNKNLWEKFFTKFSDTFELYYGIYDKIEYSMFINNYKKTILPMRTLLIKIKGILN